MLEFEEKCDFLKFFHVSDIRRVAFHQLCGEISNMAPSVLQLGVSLMQLLLASPRDGKLLSTWISTQFEQSSTTPFRVRDVLPLPLTPVGAALKLVARLKATPSGLLDVNNLKSSADKKRGRQQMKRLVREGTHQLWRVMVVLMLNGMNDDWLFKPWKRNKASPTQLAAISVIDSWVETFCQEPQKHVTLPIFPDLVRARSIDYSGEEVSHALPLRLEELLPGLPVEGVAGSLSAVQAATGAIKAWVEDPYLTLKPPESWPKTVPQARINASRSEWYKVCKVLYDRGIIESIPLEKVFHAGGIPVLNGAFTVEKKGKAEGNAKRVTRLIMNFVPANTYQKLMPGDLNTLTSASSWCQLVLRQNEVLLWSGDDQRGAFYAWHLPASWRPFMAFCWPVPGQVVGSSKEWEYVASKVIPMGWIQAVSLFQHLHRQLGMAERPIGAGHPQEIEWRRDKPAPQTSDGRFTEFVQFYLDDFDCPEVVPSEGWEDMKGSMSETHRQQRLAYARWGVGISENKAHLREPKVVRMGAEIDGERGYVSAPMNKKLEVGFFAIWLMSLRHPPTKIILMVLGRLVRCFEFRRPLMVLLGRIWPKGNLQVRRPLSDMGISELLRSVALLPLAGTDLRAKVDNMITCSDASETGGGLCASGGLTEMGLEMLGQLQSPAYRVDRVLPFSPHGAISRRKMKGPRLVIVSLFDGISALMCGLCRLECQVVAFASSEVDAECKRLVRRRWPGVIELGDVTKIGQGDLDALARSCGHAVDLVLAGGGSPCQDLSVLLANRKGLQGSRSKLFFEMPRIFSGLRQAFSCPVYTFVENVFSMPKESRNEFSDTLGVEPILVDCTSVTQCRRPRLFWVDWDIAPRDGETLIWHDRYMEWVFPPLLKDRDWWLDPLCKRACKEPLPTLTRALPRSTPPRQPAGYREATDEAIARWSADRHRFQVYNYESWQMVLRPDGELRLPSLMERERLMGFPQGYVSCGLSQKLSLDEAFNTGACMLGNSFNVYSITFLLDELLRNVNPAHQCRRLDCILAREEVAPTGWCEKPQFEPSSRPNDLCRQLVQEFLRQGDKGGCDVKLDVGIPFRTKAWPRAGIRSSLLHWRIIHGYPWKHHAHINVLELQAVVNGMQWRLRKTTGFRVRLLHLVDSQVIAAIVAKGRSSSHRLRKGLNRLSALCLAGGLQLAIGYVATHDNPADLPSRWGGKPVTKLKKGANSARSSVKT